MPQPFLSTQGPLHPGLRNDNAFPDSQPFFSQSDFFLGLFPSSFFFSPVPIHDSQEAEELNAGYCRMSYTSE